MISAFIQVVNSSMNLIAASLIVFGGILSIHQPEVGKLIVSAAIGMAGGQAVQRAAQRATDVEPPAHPPAKLVTVVEVPKE